MSGHIFWKPGYFAKLFLRFPAHKYTIRICPNTLLEAFEAHAPAFCKRVGAEVYYTYKACHSAA